MTPLIQLLGPHCGAGHYFDEIDPKTHWYTGRVIFRGEIHGRWHNTKKYLSFLVNGVYPFDERTAACWESIKENTRRQFEKEIKNDAAHA